MNLLEAYYEQKFENAFLRAKADEFQTFFEQLMGLAYRADFMACRPWGNTGDRKNDGFLKSERRLFQVYAPNAVTARQAITKISEDFGGAVAYWGSYFDKWSFVHNATDGLPPHVQKLILELEKSHPGVKLDTWGLEELRLVYRRLAREDLASWFGPAPTEDTRARLGFKDLQVILESLAGKTLSPDAIVKVVPPRKIEANDLSESVATLIKSGMTKAHLVSAFLDAWHDETLADRLAYAFQQEYKRLQGTMHQNQIFAELQSWAGGKQLGSAEHQMAVLTVLAYYFERCDIFQEPRSQS